MSDYPQLPTPEPYPQPVGRGPLRASDEDRRRAEEVLSRSYEEGRLDNLEYQERLDRVWRAKLVEEVDGLTSDLQVRQLPAPRGGQLPVVLPAAQRITGAPGVGLSLALLGGSERAGHWVLAGSHFALSAMGGVTLDLREATFTEPVTTIVCIALMGGVDIIVPGDLDVEINGVGIMGGFGRAEPGQALNPRRGPGAPKVRVVGVALMGGVSVACKAHGED